MYRKALAIPAAAVVILSGAAGAGRLTSPAHARVASDTYSGTVSVSDYQVPNALGGGGLASAQTNQDLYAMVNDNAIGIDNKGNFYADLASAVPTTANGGLKVVNGDEIITYHIKPGLKWSDGSPITKGDWILNYLIDFSPDYGNVDPAKEIRTATWSGNDLVLHLKGVVGSAVQQLIPSPFPTAYYEKKYGATLPASMLVSWDYAKQTDAKTGQIPAGIYASSGLKKLTTAWISDNYISPNDVFNGPYKIKQWSPDQRYVLEANPNYTALPATPGHPRPAIIQQIVLSEDGTTYIQDLKAASTYNTIDSATDFNPDNLSDLKQTKYQVVVQPALGYELLDLMVGPTFNGRPNPLHDVRVRQALNYAINKDIYLKALFPAFSPSQLKLTSYIPGASLWSIDKQLPQNDYNPAKARALLAQAGYVTSLGSGSKHLNLDFVTTKKTSRIKGAQIFQRFFNQVGIGIKIRYANAVGQNGLFSSWADGGIQNHHTFQISLHGYTENPDPDEGALSYVPDQISSASNPNGANVDALNDPHLTSLFMQGRGTLDNAKRHAIYNEVQTYFYQQMYNISLFTNPDITLYKGTIGNAKPNVTQGGPWWNTFQWWYDAGNTQKALFS
ncbi:MAG: extracellular solute-binding protein family 5 [Chloroflexi bacterium]|nr:extracellular solute-binding protein family 5 [Chloroflexota bacterium]